MRISLTKVAFLGGSALAMAMAAPAAFGQSTAPQEPAVGNSVETVVVTANKRAQSLLNVAATVDVLKPEDIESQGLTSLTDWAKMVPGMSFFGRGQTGFNQVILDGITSGSQQTSPTVAIYVNDAPYSFSIPYGGFSSILQADLDPFDLERIEVLKGPQGTLYGASTLGGLIKYVTKQPTTDGFTLDAQAGMNVVDGGGLGFVFRGAVNVPISSDLAVRISAFDRRDAGFIDNLETGTNNANVNNAHGVRTTIAYTPVANFRADFNIVYQDSVQNAEDANDINPTTMQPINGKYDQSRFVNERWSTKDVLVDGSLRWDLSDVSLQSTTTYAFIDGTALFDFSPVLPPGFFGGQFFTGPQHADYGKFTQELRAMSPDDSGPWSWIVGLFYTKELAKPGSTIEQFGPTGAFQQTDSISISHGEYEEYAGYGNLTYTFAKQLDITGGVRWSGNKQDSKDLVSGPLSGLPLTTFQEQIGSSTASAATWLGSINWRYSDNGSVYFRAASGYRPGGPIEPPPGIPSTIKLPSSFNSDSVVNYEIGEKSSWFDNRLQTSASAFYVNWSDIQLPFIVNGFRELANGGGAISKGFDTELTARPFDPLTARLTASYTDAYLTAPVPLLGALVGDRLPFVPQWTLAASLRYDFSVTDDVEGFVSGDWSYVSSIVTSYTNDPNNRRLDGYGQFGLQAGADFSNNLSVNLYARNLFNKYALTSGEVFGSVFEGVVLQPATFGILVTKKFD